MAGLGAVGREGVAGEIHSSPTPQPTRPGPKPCERFPVRTSFSAHLSLHLPLSSMAQGSLPHSRSEPVKRQILTISVQRNSARFGTGFGLESPSIIHTAFIPLTLRAVLSMRFIISRSTSHDAWYITRAQVIASPLVVLTLGQTVTHQIFIRAEDCATHRKNSRELEMPSLTRWKL